MDRDLSPQHVPGFRSVTLTHRTTPGLAPGGGVNDLRMPSQRAAISPANSVRTPECTPGGGVDRREDQGRAADQPHIPVVRSLAKRQMLVKCIYWSSRVFKLAETYVAVPVTARAASVTVSPGWIEISSVKANACPAACPVCMVKIN